MASTIIPVTIGRVSVETDARIARMVLWLLRNQALLQSSTCKLTIHAGGQSLKYSIETYHQDRVEDGV